MQTEGIFGDIPFYFRARHKHWTFTACLSHSDYNPSFLNPGNVEQGVFSDGEYRGYILSDYFAGASSMRYDDAERIIRKSIKVYGDNNANHLQNHL